MMKDCLSNGCNVSFSPVNDIKGDCGVKLGLLFESASRVEQILLRSKEVGIESILECPFNTDKHVFMNWKAILERRGACTEMLNPYRNSSVTYDMDSYKSSLELLKRTLYIQINPNASRDFVEKESEKLARVMRAV